LDFGARYYYQLIVSVVDEYVVVHIDTILKALLPVVFPVIKDSSEFGWRDGQGQILVWWLHKCGSIDCPGFATVLVGQLACVGGQTLEDLEVWVQCTRRFVHLHGRSSIL
jgi:hypothetical protein